MADDIEVVIKTIDESTAPTQQMAGGYEELIAQLVELNRSADVTNAQLANLGDVTEKATAQNDDATLSMTSLNQGLEVVTKALGYAQQAYDATIGVSQTYAEQIRNLSAISGQSAEDTSRFVQVLDDWQVSAEDATAATRILTKQGLAPNMETIATLSDRYLALNSVEERNEFITKNLGRAGMGWVQVLEQGSATLRAQSDAVSANLILGEKQLKQAEALRLAQDQMNDTLEGLKITIGTRLTPAMATWTTLLDRSLNGTLKVRDGWLSMLGPAGQLINLTTAYGDVHNELQAKLANTTTANKALSVSQADIEERVKAEKEAFDALSATYSTLLSLSMTLQGQSDSFAQATATITQQQAALKLEIDASTLSFGANSEKTIDLQGKYDALGQKSLELAEKNGQAMAKIAYDNLIAKLSVDGLTSAEFATAQQVGVTLGLYTQATANKAIALDKLTSSLARQEITVSQFTDAYKSGTYAVDESTAASIQSFDQLEAAVSYSAAGASTAITGMADTTAQVPGVTKSATDATAVSWDVAAKSINSNVYTLKLMIDEYIKKLKSIPKEVNTLLTTSTNTGGGGGGPGGEQPLGAQNEMTGGGSIIYNITNAYIGADHELSVYG